MKTLRESLLDIDSVQSGLEPITIIKSWCKENVKGRYKIDPKTLDINSNDNIEITNKDITEIPDYIHFGTVGGYFDCSDCKLTSLRGCPKIVSGNFNCFWCENLTSLEGAPEKVGKNFHCSRCNNLTSLEGAPKEVGGSFYCSNCDSLTSLKGVSEKIGDEFSCMGCEKLEMFEMNMKQVKTFNCNVCSKLKSLKGLPKKISGSLKCSYCDSLTNLDGIPKEIDGHYVGMYNDKLNLTEQDVRKMSKIKGDVIISICPENPLAFS